MPFEAQVYLKGKTDPNVQPIGRSVLQIPSSTGTTEGIRVRTNGPETSNTLRLVVLGDQKSYPITIGGEKKKLSQSGSPQSRIYWPDREHCPLTIRYPENRRGIEKVVIDSI